MKTIHRAILSLALFIPFSVLAQEAPVSKEFSQTLLTIAIILGLMASVYVFVLSLKLGGGAIAGALLLYGAGMISVCISLLSVTWLKPYAGGFAGVSHDMFFIIGFILMVIGSHRVAKMIS